MKIAIIGSKGQLGSDLVKVFDKEYVIPLTHDDIEVTDYNSCKKLMSLSPDIVINTAAFHKTDACEDEPIKTFNVNSIGSKYISEICGEIDACHVYISTDFVFDGNKGKPYTEEDYPNPINTYGISKIAGEQFAKHGRNYIIRISSLFGAAGASGKGGNFVETMIKKARNNEEINVVDDMMMSPTYAKDAAIMIKKIIENKIPFGTYHVTNEGDCSWYKFARTIFELLDLKVKLHPIKTKNINLKANRPKNSALMSVKLNKHEMKMLKWEYALEQYLKEKRYIKES